MKNDYLYTFILLKLNLFVFYVKNFLIIIAKYNRILGKNNGS